MTDEAEARRLRRDLLHRKLEAIKGARGCARCPERDPLCLHFHHVDPATKEQDVSRMVAAGRSWEAVLAETEKCEVLCANCHAKHHGEACRQRRYTRRGRRAR